MQVPLALTITEEAVALQALAGLAFTPTNLTLVELAVSTPIFLSTVLTEKVPLARLGLGVVKASSAEYPAVVSAVLTKSVKLLATSHNTARSFISG